jgi:hypothetical protein
VGATRLITQPFQAVPGRDDTSRAHPRDVAVPQLAERDAA